MSDSPIRIGLLFMGDEHKEIWGSAITTFYLGEALAEGGAKVWRASATHTCDWRELLREQTDLVIAEGVPANRLPAEFRHAGTVTVFWSLSDLFSAGEAVLDLEFDGVATNSAIVLARLTEAGVPAARIDMAASPSFASAPTANEHRGGCVYLGCYPHKSPQQMDMLFAPAARFGLSIWGYGWEDSPYSSYARGPLPLRDIPALYHSADVVLALTEERQKALGMVNNRVYEALACGAVVLSDEHPALEASELGAGLNFAAEQADAERFLWRLFYDHTFAHDCRVRTLCGRDLVLDRHTYQDRAKAFLSFYRHLLERRHDR